MLAADAEAPILNLDHGTAETISTDACRRQVMPPAKLLQSAKELVDL